MPLSRRSSTGVTGIPGLGMVDRLYCYMKDLIAILFHMFCKLKTARSAKALAMKPLVCPEIICSIKHHYFVVVKSGAIE